MHCNDMLYHLLILHGLQLMASSFEGACLQAAPESCRNVDQHPDLLVVYTAS